MFSPDLVLHIAVATMSSKGQLGYTYEFLDTSHPAQFLDSMWEFYVEGLFTDVTLQCSSGQEFQCHRVALATRSPFFRGMFTADMRERSDSLVRLPGMDSDVLGTLLEFVYTSRVTVTQGNVEKLLEAADMLQLVAVKAACEGFLVRLLDVDNCLGMKAFAELHACKDLEREARRMVHFRFEELAGQEEFLEVQLIVYTVISMDFYIFNIVVHRVAVVHRFNTLPYVGNPGSSLA